LFLKYGLDIDRLLNAVSEKYSFPEKMHFDAGKVNILYSSGAYNTFWNFLFFFDVSFMPLYLFYNLLSSDSVLKLLEELDVMDLVQAFDVK